MSIFDDLVILHEEYTEGESNELRLRTKLQELAICDLKQFIAQQQPTDMVFSQMFEAFISSRCSLAGMELLAAGYPFSAHAFTLLSLYFSTDRDDLKEKRSEVIKKFLRPDSSN